MRNPTKEDVIRLSALLDKRNPIMGSTALKRLPNEHMKGFNAGREARIHTETYQRFAGED